MKHGQPQTVYLKDYSAPAYQVQQIDLVFELGEDFTLVTNTAQYQRQSPQASPLLLDGQDLELISLSLNGKALTQDAYQVTDSQLIISQVPEQFSLTIVTRIYPQRNTSLEGLYQSSGNFCTQCEAQGFRKITYYQDRPDVMSVFSTNIIADKQKYPVLLSNGN